jgi:hypothetical protein
MGGALNWQMFLAPSFGHLCSKSLPTISLQDIDLAYTKFRNVGISKYYPIDKPKQSSIHKSWCCVCRPHWAENYHHISGSLHFHFTPSNLYKHILFYIFYNYCVFLMFMSCYIRASVCPIEPTHLTLLY